MPETPHLVDIVRLANTATGVLNHLGLVMTLQLAETGSYRPETMAAVESAAYLLGVADANLHLLQVDLKPFYN